MCHLRNVLQKLMETNIIYNLIEYNSNYSETNGRLWFYSKNEATNFNADLTNTNNFKSFNYKAKLLANTEADGDGEILKKFNNCCSCKIFA